MAPLVLFRDVQKSYRTLQGATYLVVEHFDAGIEAGEFFCLLGPSGCGKTTVLKMLAGLKASTGGEILMDDRPVTGLPRPHAQGAAGEGELQAVDSTRP